MQLDTKRYQYRATLLVAANIENGTESSRPIMKTI